MSKIIVEREHIEKMCEDLFKFYEQLPIVTDKDICFNLGCFIARLNSIIEIPEDIDNQLHAS